MHQVNLSDQMFEEVRRRAAEAGFASVDEFVADILASDFCLATEDLSNFFTPERLKLIDEAAADVASGNSFTAEEAKQALAQSRAAWLSRHARGE
jgi:hypothetical protein